MEKNKYKGFEVIFEDDFVIVINKFKDIVVHPTKYIENDTIIQQLKEKIKVDEFEDQMRPGVVHRLDKNTSGLMTICKNKKAFDSIRSQIEDKKLMRKYCALVHNKYKEKHLLLRLPLILSKNKLKYIVSKEEKAKIAITEVFLIKNYKVSALVNIVLHTGRTHQIRSHMAYINHPIYNDELYGRNDGYKNYGQFLFSQELTFKHPDTNKTMNFSIEADEVFNNLNKKLENEL
jgi:23S rRNA pseudouridine1911/1915/1917 synthase